MLRRDWPVVNLVTSVGVPFLGIGLILWVCTYIVHVTRRMSFSTNDEVLRLYIHCACHQKDVLLHKRWSIALVLTIQLDCALWCFCSYIYISGELAWLSKQVSIHLLAQWHCFFDFTAVLFRARFSCYPHILCILSGVLLLLMGSYWPMLTVGKAQAESLLVCGFCQCWLSLVWQHWAQPVE